MSLVWVGQAFDLAVVSLSIVLGVACAVQMEREEAKRQKVEWEPRVVKEREIEGSQ